MKNILQILSVIFLLSILSLNTFQLKANAPVLKLSDVSEVEHLITKEYSYKEISGLDLNINPTDYFILSEDKS